jgi:uncharacterized membrane protein YkoI
MVAVIVTGGVFAASGTAASGPPPGHLDNGAELLDQAFITIEEAIAAAQAYETGDLGEVDLEDYQGPLVFNVDIGVQDVKVDASDGTVLGSESDDGDKND